MADKVVLDQTEINQFTGDLIAYHKEIMTGMKSIKRKMEAFNSGGKIFAMDRTSKRIETLLDTIDTEVLPPIYNTLGESNQCADLLIQIMNGLDS